MAYFALGSSTEAWCKEVGGSPIYNQWTGLYTGCSGSVSKPLPLQPVTSSVDNQLYMSTEEAKAVAAQQGQTTPSGLTPQPIDTNTGWSIKTASMFSDGSFGKVLPLALIPVGLFALAMLLRKRG